MPLPFLTLKYSSWLSLINGIFDIDVGSKVVGRFEEVTKERAGDSSGAKCSLTTDAGDIVYAFPSVLRLHYVYFRDN